MVWYERGRSTEIEVTDRFPHGTGWIAHPQERGRRVSHAILGDDGVWIVDPLEAPGTEALLGELGSVAGVAVLSDYHTRDAATFARRYDVPVSVPAWFRRAPRKLAVSTESIERELGTSGFEIRRYTPFPLWREGFVVHEEQGTLYAPECLSTLDSYRVEPEQIGIHTAARLRPPTHLCEGLQPDRVLCGHGAGVFEGASTALRQSLAGARRRFPAALRDHGLARLHAALEAAIR